MGIQYELGGRLIESDVELDPDELDGLMDQLEPPSAAPTQPPPGLSTETGRPTYRLPTGEEVQSGFEKSLDVASTTVLPKPVVESLKNASPKFVGNVVKTLLAGTLGRGVAADYVLDWDAEAVGKDAVHLGLDFFSSPVSLLGYGAGAMNRVKALATAKGQAQAREAFLEALKKAQAAGARPLNVRPGAPRTLESLATTPPKLLGFVEPLPQGVSAGEVSTYSAQLGLAPTAAEIGTARAAAGTPGLKTARELAVERAGLSPGQPRVAKPLPVEAQVAPPAGIAPQAAPGLKERGFVRTLRESGQVPEEIMRQIGTPYAPITDKAALGRATTMIEQNPQETIQRIVGADLLGKDDVAAALLLTKQAIQENRIDEAIRIADAITTKATTQGQAIQALSIWSGLSPEAWLRKASQVFEKANAVLRQTPVAVRRVVHRGVAKKTPAELIDIIKQGLR